MDMGYSPLVPILTDLEGKLLNRGKNTAYEKKRSYKYGNRPLQCDI